MKKKEIKGLSAFELLEGLDDDMILSASLPEAVPVAPPTAGEKITAFFARMGKGGMAAAITGIVVAAAVLIGILLAGRFPVWEEPGIETEPGPVQSRPNIDSGILYPPLTETPDQDPGAVAVVSDGITVYPQGYCVWESGLHRNEQGELEGYDADGRGAVDMLDRLWDMLPVLRTAGNDFDAVLPDHMTLRSVRVFEMVEVQTKTFEELALISDEMEDYRDRPWEFLSTLRGEYTVVLEVYHEINYSEDEYTKGVDEYAFRLDVDPTMNDKAPVRVIHGGKTYFPTGYLLEESYYDAELKQEVTKHYDGAESILAELAPAMVTATVARGESLGLYLAPFYELKWVRVFDSSLHQLYEMGYDSPLDTFSETEEAGDYYVIITAVFMGTGATTVDEYPIHIRIVEEREEESTPAGDVGETPLPPRVSVGSGYGGLDFGNTSHSREYNEGYMLWTEQWYDGGMVSGDGFGATGQLSDISDGLPVLRHNAGEEPFLRVYEDEDTLTRIYVYREDHSFYFDAEAAPILTSLPVGRYVIVLRVETQGDYIEEADAYERTCTEYAFWLDVVEPPETTSYILVTGGGQQVELEAEKDGFLAWREVDLSHQVVTPAASVIFADDDAMRALPHMEITYGTPLNLSPREADDALYGVLLYTAKGEMIAESNSLSVVDTLENDGWDRGVILVLQIISSVSETERVCYEYAIDLTITQP